MNSLYKIEIELFLNELVAGQLMERTRKNYRETGAAVQRDGNRNVVLSAEEFIEGPEDALMELLEQSIRSALPGIELRALRCSTEPSTGHERD